MSGRCSSTSRHLVEPGHYLLEVDLLQEWIAWFANRGSTTLRASGGGQPRRRIPRRMSEAKLPINATTRRQVRSRHGWRCISWRARRCSRRSRRPEGLCSTPSPETAVAPRSRASTTSWPGLSVPGAARLAPFGLPGRRDASARAFAPEPRIVAERRRARGLMEDRLDLVEFDLTSTLGRLGRTSILLRSVVRRALYQVLSRPDGVQPGHRRPHPEPRDAGGSPGCDGRGACRSARAGAGRGGAAGH